MPSLLVIAALPLSVAGHGRMTFPANRLGGRLDIAGSHDNCQLGENKGGLPHSLNTCGYQNRGTRVSHPTNCDASKMTGNLIHSAPSNGDCSKVDAKHSPWQMPWAAPGKAALWSVCGVNGGHKNPGDKQKDGSSYPSPRDGTSLPPNVPTKWVIGQTVEVAFALTKNHGGGYQWRICPGHSDSHVPPASCFEANPLTFASDDTEVRWTNGKKASYKAIKVNGNHVTPANSEFRVIRIPLTDRYKANPSTEPCSGCHGNVLSDHIVQEWDFSLVDKVHVPNVPTGHAWLQWRWDNEQQDQVWTGCADIEIVAGGGPTPSPAPPAPPSPGPAPPPPSPGPAPSPGHNCLHAGDSLKSGTTLVSPGGQGHIQMQVDGNLVIRDSSHNSRWHSDSAGHSGAQLNFHSSDGNLVVKDSHGQSYWSSGAHQGAASACITDDCSFIVKDASGHSLWSSGSTCSSATVEVI